MSARATLFSSCFGALYFVCFLYDIALFRYYPEAGEFRLGEATALGPPIVWYGWVGAAALGSTIIALAVPSWLVTRMPSSVCWIATAVVLIVVLFYERRWFL